MSCSPEVARDGDPVGWVRAAAYDYALAPWRRWLRGRWRPRPAPREALAAALLELPPPRRRAVLLFDGVGLDLAEVAVEVEASTAAAAGRIAAAREALAAAVPPLAAEEDGGEAGAAVATGLRALLEDGGYGYGPVPSPAATRAASERGARRRVVASFALSALIAAATAVVVLLGPAVGHGHGLGRERPQGPGAGQDDGVGPFPSGGRAHAVER